LETVWERKKNKFGIFPEIKARGEKGIFGNLQLLFYLLPGQLIASSVSKKGEANFP